MHRKPQTSQNPQIISHLELAEDVIYYLWPRSWVQVDNHGAGA